MFGFSSNILFAQQKFEKESRIKPEEVPSSAIRFIDSLSLKKKVKWYVEEGLVNKSFEAKFNFKNRKHSIEFDKLGNIEDAEIEIEWDEIEPTLKDKIIAQLKSDCQTHKISKIQMQYSGSASEILLKLKENKIADRQTAKYELVVRCKTKDQIVLFEYLFDYNAKVISKSEILFRNSSHLEY